jgi:uncharacterized membrane protein YeaQ/YmgE (transglycosylase-associated protein family)
VAWLLAGIVVLAIAWALRPRSEDPLALGPTILAGVGGAVLGGILSSLLGAEEGPPGLRTVFFASTGAMAAMLVFRLIRRRGSQ